MKWFGDKILNYEAIYRFLYCCTVHFEDSLNITPQQIL